MKNKTELYSFEDKYTEYYSMPKFFHAGKEFAKAKFGYPEHHHVNYEWIYIKRGSVKYWINDVPMQADKGDSYFVEPGQTHKEELAKGPLEFYYIRFYYLDSKGKINYLMPLHGNPEKQIIKNAGRDFEKIFIKIYKEAIEKKPGSKQIIESLILYMIWLLLRKNNLKCTPTDKVDHKIELVNKAIKYINENADKNITLSNLSSYCCISQDYLSHIFKKIAGISPIQYTLRLKISEAKSLLKETDLSIRSISLKLGFQDQMYFSRTFKRITGLSPNKYRK